MKKFFYCISLIVLLSSQISAQSNNRISLHYGLLDSELITFAILDGAAGHSNSHSSEIGLMYSRVLSEKTFLKIGLNIIRADVEISFNHPDFENKQESLHLVSIPILFGLELKRHFYLNPGISIDFQHVDRLYDSQSGIGVSIGVGKRFYLNDFYFNINPSISMHAVIPFKKERNHQKLLKANAQIGVGYQF